MDKVTIDHADIKGKLCKPDGFPKQAFQEAGKKLMGPDYDPVYKHIFREDELEQGEAIVRDGFYTVVVSSLKPSEYETALAECIPLTYMKPVYLKFAS